MPITAKLSRKFYEKLGDEVTNELVSWLNAVDESYRQEFRELFATSFGRVEAELARLRTEFDAKQAQLRAELDAKLSQLEARLRVEISETKSSLIRWMLGFWVGQVAVTIGAILAARQLLR